METAASESEKMKKIAGLKLYNVAEVAKLLAISTKTVLKYIDDGQFGKPRRIGKGYYITEEKLRAFIENDAQEEEETLTIEDSFRVEEAHVGSAPDDETPFVDVRMVPANDGGGWAPGTIVRLNTPYLVVGTDGALIPMRADLEDGPEPMWSDDDAEFWAALGLNGGEEEEASDDDTDA